MHASSKQASKQTNTWNWRFIRMDKWRRFLKTVLYRKQKNGHKTSKINSLKLSQFYFVYRVLNLLFYTLDKVLSLENRTVRFGPIKLIVSRHQQNRIDIVNCLFIVNSFYRSRKLLLCSYSDLVSKHWPGFAKNGKENVTIQMALSHMVSSMFHFF